MRNLELMLLNYWKDEGIEEVYKYKHRVKAFREPLVNFELFFDLTSGNMFTDVEDVANYRDVLPEECKVSVDILINNRK